ncbi:hypothetical protein XELAEV_18000041mg [Xenopus laevis]|uniref:Helix-turn-helix domain-containing protein n=1 Tax=Xenopus laevis TaxID=8355 RepID=A0A974BQW7_XENLA|nr:hypothetical protein XELAEV_18000041mg [Xenopus laevis]
MLRVEGNSINTSIFRKPCSGNTLLYASSCHPKKLIEGIPVGKFLRLRRNCSTNKDFGCQAREMQRSFLERGYKHKNIQKAFQRAKGSDREDLLKGSGNKTKGHEWSEKVALTTRYSKQFCEISKILKKCLPVLYGDEHFFKVLSPGITIIPKRAHTLKDMLSPSLFRMNCQKRDQQHMKVSKKFKSTVTGREFDIKGYINYNTIFVIYLIICLRCQKQYVGCTSR